MAVSSSSFFNVIKQLIDLPKGCQSVTIHLELNDAVTVDCRYLASMNLRDENGDVPVIAKRFRLEEIELEEIT